MGTFLSTEFEWERDQYQKWYLKDSSPQNAAALEQLYTCLAEQYHMKATRNTLERLQAKGSTEYETYSPAVLIETPLSAPIRFVSSLKVEDIVGSLGTDARKENEALVPTATMDPALVLTSMHMTSRRRVHDDTVSAAKAKEEFEAALANGGASRAKFIEDAAPVKAPDHCGFSDEEKRHWYQDRAFFHTFMLESSNPCLYTRESAPPYRQLHQQYTLDALTMGQHSNPNNKNPILPDEFAYSLWNRHYKDEYHVAAWTIGHLLTHFGLLVAHSQSLQVVTELVDVETLLGNTSPIPNELPQMLPESFDKATKMGYRPVLVFQLDGTMRIAVARRGGALLWRVLIDEMRRLVEAMANEGQTQINRRLFHERERVESLANTPQQRGLTPSGTPAPSERSEDDESKDSGGRALLAAVIQVVNVPYISEAVKDLAKATCMMTSSSHQEQEAGDGLDTTMTLDATMAELMASSVRSMSDRLTVTDVKTPQRSPFEQSLKVPGSGGGHSPSGSRRGSRDEEQALFGLGMTSPSSLTQRRMSSDSRAKQQLKNLPLALFSNEDSSVVDAARWVYATFSTTLHDYDRDRELLRQAAGKLRKRRKAEEEAAEKQRKREAKRQSQQREEDSMSASSAKLSQRGVQFAESTKLADGNAPHVPAKIDSATKRGRSVSFFLFGEEGVTSPAAPPPPPLPSEGVLSTLPPPPGQTAATTTPQRPTTTTDDGAPSTIPRMSSPTPDGTSKRKGSNEMVDSPMRRSRAKSPNMSVDGRTPKKPSLVPTPPSALKLDTERGMEDQRWLDVDPSDIADLLRGTIIAMELRTEAPEFTPGDSSPQAGNDADGDLLTSSFAGGSAASVMSPRDDRRQQRHRRSSINPAQLRMLRQSNAFKHRLFCESVLDRGGSSDMLTSQDMTLGRGRSNRAALQLLDPSALAMPSDPAGGRNHSIFSGSQQSPMMDMPDSPGVFVPTAKIRELLTLEPKIPRNTETIQRLLFVLCLHAMDVLLRARRLEAALTKHETRAKNCVIHPVRIEEEVIGLQRLCSSNSKQGECAAFPLKFLRYSDQYQPTDGIHVPPWVENVDKYGKPTGVGPSVHGILAAHLHDDMENPSNSQGRMLRISATRAGYFVLRPTDAVGLLALQENADEDLSGAPDHRQRALVAPPPRVYDNECPSGVAYTSLASLLAAHSPHFARTLGSATWTPSDSHTPVIPSPSISEYELPLQGLEVVHYPIGHHEITPAIRRWLAFAKEEWREEQREEALEAIDIRSGLTLEGSLAATILAGGGRKGHLQFDLAISGTLSEEQLRRAAGSRGCSPELGGPEFVVPRSRVPAVLAPSPPPGKPKTKRGAAEAKPSNQLTAKQIRDINRRKEFAANLQSRTDVFARLQTQHTRASSSLVRKEGKPVDHLTDNEREYLATLDLKKQAQQGANASRGSLTANTLSLHNVHKQRNASSATACVRSSDLLYPATDRATFPDVVSMVLHEMLFTKRQQLQDGVAEDDFASQRLSSQPSLCSTAQYILTHSVGQLNTTNTAFGRGPAAVAWRLGLQGVAEATVSNNATSSIFTAAGRVPTAIDLLTDVLQLTTPSPLTTAEDDNHLLGLGLEEDTNSSHTSGGPGMNDAFYNALGTVEKLVDGCVGQTMADGRRAYAFDKILNAGIVELLATIMRPFIDSGDVEDGDAENSTVQGHGKMAELAAADRVLVVVLISELIHTAMTQLVASNSSVVATAAAQIVVQVFSLSCKMEYLPNSTTQQRGGGSPASKQPSPVWMSLNSTSASAIVASASGTASTSQQPKTFCPQDEILRYFSDVAAHSILSRLSRCVKYLRQKLTTATTILSNETTTPKNGDGKDGPSGKSILAEMQSVQKQVRKAATNPKTVASGSTSSATEGDEFRSSRAARSQAGIICLFIASTAAVSPQARHVWRTMKACSATQQNHDVLEVETVPVAVAGIDTSAITLAAPKLIASVLLTVDHRSDGVVVAASFALKAIAIPAKCVSCEVPTASSRARHRGSSAALLLNQDSHVNALALGEQTVLDDLAHQLPPLMLQLLTTNPALSQPQATRPLLPVSSALSVVWLTSRLSRRHQEGYHKGRLSAYISNFLKRILRKRYTFGFESLWLMATISSQIVAPSVGTYKRFVEVFGEYLAAIVGPIPDTKFSFSTPTLPSPPLEDFVSEKPAAAASRRIQIGSGVQGNLRASAITMMLAAGAVVPATPYGPLLRRDFGASVGKLCSKACEVLAPMPAMVMVQTEAMVATEATKLLAQSVLGHLMDQRAANSTTTVAQLRSGSVHQSMSIHAPPSGLASPVQGRPLQHLHSGSYRMDTDQPSTAAAPPRLLLEPFGTPQCMMNITQRARGVSSTTKSLCGAMLTVAEALSHWMVTIQLNVEEEFTTLADPLPTSQLMEALDPFNKSKLLSCNAAVVNVCTAAPVAALAIDLSPQADITGRMMLMQLTLALFALIEGGASAEEHITALNKLVTSSREKLTVAVKQHLADRTQPKATLGRVKKDANQLFKQLAMLSEKLDTILMVTTTWLAPTMKALTTLLSQPHVTPRIISQLGIQITPPGTPAPPHNANNKQREDDDDDVDVDFDISPPLLEVVGGLHYIIQCAKAATVIILQQQQKEDGVGVAEESTTAASQTARSNPSTNRTAMKSTAVTSKQRTTFFGLESNRFVSLVLLFVSRVCYSPAVFDLLFGAIIEANPKSGADEGSSIKAPTLEAIEQLATDVTAIYSDDEEDLGGAAGRRRTSNDDSTDSSQPIITAVPGFMDTILVPILKASRGNSGHFRQVEDLRRAQSAAIACATSFCTAASVIPEGVVDETSPPDLQQAEANEKARTAYINRVGAREVAFLLVASARTVLPEAAIVLPKLDASASTGVTRSAAHLPLPTTAVDLPVHGSAFEVECGIDDPCQQLLWCVRYFLYVSRSGGHVPLPSSFASRKASDSLHGSVVADGKSPPGPTAHNSSLRNIIRSHSSMRQAGSSPVPGSPLSSSPLMSPGGGGPSAHPAVVCLAILRSHFGDPIAPLSAVATVSPCKALKEEAEALIYLWQVGVSMTTPSALRGSNSFVGTGSFAAGSGHMLPPPVVPDAVGSSAV